MQQIVLLSGGLDSAVCLAKGVRVGEVKLALNFDYGQLAARREQAQAGALAAHYGVPFEVLDLPFLARLTGTALVAVDQNLPELDRGQLDNPELTRASANSVWVPNRNGLFLNIAACYAESLGCEAIVAGFNAEEAQTFPDNSSEYAEAVNRAFDYSTRGMVRVISYTQELTKPQIVQLGAELGLPFDLLWSCYRGEEQMCGRCESCQRLKRGLAEAGLFEVLSKLGWQSD
jgi:7-cyano-7-deazaguanine synthase